MKLHQAILCLLLATCCLLGSCGYTNQPPVESTNQTTEQPTTESTIESTEQTDTQNPTLTIDPTEFVVQPTVVDSVEVLDYDGNPFIANVDMSPSQVQELYSSNGVNPVYHDASYFFVFLLTPNHEPVIGIAPYVDTWITKMSGYWVFPSDYPLPTDETFEQLRYPTSMLELLQLLGTPTNTFLSGSSSPCLEFTSESGNFYRIEMCRNSLQQVYRYSNDWSTIEKIYGYYFGAKDEFIYSEHQNETTSTP